jgi:hypothetical protein
MHYSPRKPLFDAFVQLGMLMDAIGQNQPWPGYGCGLSEEEYTRLKMVPEQVKASNGWFTEENVRHALRAWGELLRPESLGAWLAPYIDKPCGSGKTVALIMAGNVPLVGFHDLLCVLMSGHKALIKLSSEDDKLLPILVKILGTFCEEGNDSVRWAEGKLTSFDAVIATGSDNSARYFEYYFGSHPRIVRKNRTSVAVVTHETSDEELALLGEDIFRYFGLGCRNVTKMFVPKDFDLNRFFGAIYKWHPISTHNKYANNYDYHKAIWLLNEEPLLENGFLLLKEDQGLHSPVGSLFYERYESPAEVEQRLSVLKDEIQCVVSHGKTPFGKAQSPSLSEYADGIDTMAFLLKL